MTVDCPLTCYMCGKTKDEWMTVDLIGTLKNSTEAEKRFEEKHGCIPDSFLFICSDCHKNNPIHAKRIEKKYGIFGCDI